MPPRPDAQDPVSGEVSPAGAPIRLHVEASEGGQRLDRFLAARLGDRTRSALRRIILEGAVRVDARSALKPGLRLEPGMRVDVELPVATVASLAAETFDLTVVHEDAHVLIVDKPAGMVVHPGHGRREGTLVNALLGRGTPLAEAGGPDRPGIVHRLDAGTSGLLLVAKTDASFHALRRAFARREVLKEYVALVWGHVDPPLGRIEGSIGRSRVNRLKMAMRGSEGRPALTEYRAVESLPGFDLLEVRPHTGRTHQIRVHLQSLHHPIVGDDRYGGLAWRGVQDPLKRRALAGFARLALHASRLVLAHPCGGGTISVAAPLPAEFVALLDVLRRDRTR